MFRRGELVLASVPGDYGKPRPNLVVRADLFELIPSLTVCPLSTTIREDLKITRITVVPTAQNGLQIASQIAIDKISTIRLSRVSVRIGTLSDDLLDAVNRSLAVYLGLA